MTGPRMILGVVPLEGRGSLPLLDLHREALFVHAVRALLDVDAVAGRVVVTVDPGHRAAAEAALDRSGLAATVRDAHTWWQTVTHTVTVVLHDPLCPLVPASFLADCLEDSSAQDRAVVAFRPVTDTIKTVVDEHIADTLDRDQFCIVTSPVAFGHEPISSVPPTTDFGMLVTWLRERGPVGMRKAPSLGRRVDDASAVNLLECIDEMARSVRES